MSMNLYQKLLEMQKGIDAFVKDNTVGEGKSAYKAVGSEQVLDAVRPMMNEHGLLLIPSVTGATVTTGATSSGTARYFTELEMMMTWHDVESGEELPVKWYGQGVDLAGEKGVGKANTYAEKYFFMKFFHVPTPKDDPDAATRTKSGELRQRGTEAEKEKLAMMRTAVSGMLGELYKGNEEKTKEAYLALTSAKSRGYAGVDNLSEVSDAALPILYGKLSGHYEKHLGHKYIKKDDSV